MTGKKPKDLAASVRARLLQVARQSGEEFQYVLTRFALERLLYRLSRSKHETHFVLKGAMLFQLWAGRSHRPTRDLDLLSDGTPSVPRLEELFRDICGEPVEDDGLIFLAGRIKGEQIKEEDEYQGIRIRGEAKLGNAKVPLQIDIGFGDAITPGPQEINYPTLLGFPAPNLLAYNRETVVAEKFQAMVLLGMANSRMKDFFDVWSLAGTFAFDGRTLSAAIAATFQRRKTELPAETPLALSEEFSADRTKQTQWSAFLRKGSLEAGGADLKTVVTVIRSFLMPPLDGLRTNGRFSATWKRGGPWQD